MLLSYLRELREAKKKLSNGIGEPCIEVSADKVLVSGGRVLLRMDGLIGAVEVATKKAA